MNLEWNQEQMTNQQKREVLANALREAAIAVDNGDLVEEFSVSRDTQGLYKISVRLWREKSPPPALL